MYYYWISAVYFNVSKFHEDLSLWRKEVNDGGKTSEEQTPTTKVVSPS
jgi:hypothetical protein